MTIMNIAFAPRTYDPIGHVLINADRKGSSIGELSRRVSRTATLDGGCAIYDTGLSHADRTFTVAARVDAAAEAALKRLQAYYSLIGIAMPDGYYQGVIERLQCVDGYCTIRILVKELLSA